MQAFIVVLEYSGAPLLADAAAFRIPVCEHAYELETGTLAGHPAGDLPRIGFPACQRGWNSPAQTSRCLACDIAVQRIVRDIIAAVVCPITSRRVWFDPSFPAPGSTGSN